MKRIYNILTDILGESKQGGYSKDTSQYQWNCPWEREERDGIPDGKYNCEVNLMLGVFHCWSCDNKGPISYLIKKWGTKNQLEDYYSIIKDLKESSYFNINLFKDDGTQVYNDLRLKLPSTFKKIILKDITNQKLLNYLYKRKISQDIINLYNIGYTTWDEKEWQLKNRIIVPSYDSIGNLNYWVGRDFTDNPKKIKYKNCNDDKNKIIFNESLVEWNSDIYLCEGIFDSLVYPNAISLMGKVLKKDSELYKSLVEKCNANIIIVLDGDTKIEETKKIYNILNYGRLRGKIWYINMAKSSNYKDFAEIYENDGKNGIIKLFKNKKQFSEIELFI